MDESNVFDKLFEELDPNVIEHDKLDSHNFKKIREKSGRLEESINEAREELSTANKLSEDLFYSLYKYNPKPNEKENIQPEYRMNKDFIDKTMDTKEYETLRSRTTTNEMQSAMGTVSFLSTLAEEASDEEIQELNEKSKEIEQQRNSVEQLKERLEGIKSVDDKDSNLKERIKNTKKELEEKKQELQGSKEKLEEKLKDNSSTVRNAMRKGMKAAKKDTKQMEDLMAGWGLEDSNDIQSMPLEERLELAKDLKDNKKLQKIAKKMGSMKRLALSVEKQKVNKQPDEIQKIEQGNDLSRVLPSELVHLDEESEVLFLKKYNDGELLQYDLEGKEKKGDGPIIACVDTSGSMQGDKEIWAKGVAAGLYHIAKRRDRPFVGILFAASKEAMKVYNMDPNELSDNTLVKRFKNFCEMMLGGGTNFEHPLRKSVNIINEDETYEKADIAFITDGEAEISDELKTDLAKLKDKMEFKIFGVGIGDDAGGLDAFSDVVHMIDDLIEEGQETAEEAFEIL